MNSMLRWTVGSAALAVAATTFTGCVVTVEPATRWEGTAQNETLAYAGDDTIQVSNENGNILFKAGSSATEIAVKFQPFSLRADSEENLAKQDMQNDLVLTVEDTGTTVVISAALKDGASGGLGADIEVTLPAGYLGGLDISSQNGTVDGDLSAGLPAFTTLFAKNGSVELTGLAGTLDVEVGNGPCTLGIDGWSTADGTVGTGNGDITFTVASGLSGNITAVAGSTGIVQGPDPKPADWNEAANAENSKSYSFGTDYATMGTVALATEAGYSNIYIDVD